MRFLMHTNLSVIIIAHISRRTRAPSAFERSVCSKTVTISGGVDTGENSMCNLALLAVVIITNWSVAFD